MVKKFRARILPEKFKAVNAGAIVPLILEHDIYGSRLGDVEIIDENNAFIYSDNVWVGTKLSAGSFLTTKNGHDIREVSLTKNPKFPECEVLEEVKNDD